MSYPATISEQQESGVTPSVVGANELTLFEAGKGILEGPGGPLELQQQLEYLEGA